MLSFNCTSSQRNVHWELLSGNTESVCFVELSQAQHPNGAYKRGTKAQVFLRSDKCLCAVSAMSCGSVHILCLMLYVGIALTGTVAKLSYQLWTMKAGCVLAGRKASSFQRSCTISSTTLTITMSAANKRTRYSRRDNPGH